MKITLFLLKVSCFSLFFLQISILETRAGTGHDKQSWRINKVEEFFQCEIPDNWSVFNEDSRDSQRTRVFGFLSKGPLGKEGLSPSIYLRYFAEGNIYFSDTVAYMERQVGPGIIPLKGEKTSSPEAIKIADLSGFRFTKDTFEYSPPHSLETKEIPVSQEYIVLQQEKGFFVFIYAAPRASFKQYHSVFEHAVDTFKPFPKEALKKSPQEILGELPLEIGDFVAEGSIFVYEDKAMGASLNYHSASYFGSDLTVYIYDLGEPEIKSGVDSETIRKAKDSSLEEIKSLENTLYRNVKILSETEMDFSLDKAETLKALYASLSFELFDLAGGNSLGERFSYLYITGLRGYICKIRATIPSLDKEKEIQGAIKVILSSLLYNK